jgi:UDP-4-keto-D-QuiNAc 4-reductase
VYGPGVKANFKSLMRAIDAGWPLPLASLHNRRSMCYVGNLVDAILTSLDHSQAPGRAYLVADEIALPLPELIRRLAAAMARPARLFPFPASLLQFLGRLSGRRESVRRLVGSLVVECAGLRNALNWHPPYALEEALAETVHGYLQGAHQAKKRGEKP